MKKKENKIVWKKGSTSLIFNVVTILISLFAVYYAYQANLLSRQSLELEKGKWLLEKNEKKIIKQVKVQGIVDDATDILGEISGSSGTQATKRLNHSALVKARRLINRGFKLTDSSAALFRVYGNYLMKTIKGGYEEKTINEAEMAYLKSFELDGSDDRPLANLAYLYSLKGDYEKAELFYSKAIEVNPQNEANYNAFGTAYLRQNDYVNAKLNFDKALQLNPLYDFAIVNLGILHAIEGKNILAEKYFKQAIDISPKSGKAYHSLGQLYKNIGRNSEADSLAKVLKSLEFVLDPIIEYKSAY